MKTLVCGGRDYNDFEHMENNLNEIWSIDFIVSGGARGADTLAVEYARKYNIPYKIYPADWKLHGKAAGPIRNQQMLDEGQPDLVVAFRGGKGTADMIRRAKDADIEVRIIK